MIRKLVIVFIMVGSIMSISGCTEANELKEDFYSNWKEPVNEVTFTEDEVIYVYPDDYQITDGEGYPKRNFEYEEKSPIDYEARRKPVEPQEDWTIVAEEEEPEEPYTSSDILIEIEKAELDREYEEFLESEITEEEEESQAVTETTEVEIPQQSESVSVPMPPPAPITPYETPTNGPPKFIFDSDFCSDVDDAFALSLLLGYDRMGLIDLKGVSLVSSRVRSVYAASALMQKSKVYDVPIALHVETGIDMHSSYINEMGNWPHSEDYYGDNIQLYNEIFSQTQGKINIICTGQLTQIYRLMKEPIGMELIRNHVDTLYFVGTKYTGKAENNLWYGAEKYKDKVGPISKWVLANWPSRLVIIPADTGGLMGVAGFLNTSDRNCTDILTEAKKNFENLYQVTAFDPFGVFVAVMHSNGLNEQHGLTYQVGVQHAEDGGGSWWVDNPNGTHYRVILNRENSYYEGQMNQVLASEFTVRTGLPVKW